MYRSHFSSIDLHRGHCLASEGELDWFWGKNHNGTSYKNLVVTHCEGIKPALWNSCFLCFCRGIVFQKNILFNECYQHRRTMRDHATSYTIIRFLKNLTYRSKMKTKVSFLVQKYDILYASNKLLLLRNWIYTWIVSNFKHTLSSLPYYDKGQEWSTV